jgi:hypothetical protein
MITSPLLRRVTPDQSLQPFHTSTRCAACEITAATLDKPTATMAEQTPESRRNSARLAVIQLDMSIRLIIIHAGRSGDAGSRQTRLPGSLGVRDIICMKLQHDSVMTQATEIMLPNGSPRGCREGQQAHLLGEDIARALYALEWDRLRCMLRCTLASALDPCD